MKRVTRSSSKAAGSNAFFRTPIQPLESPSLLSSTFILSALMELLTTQDKRSLRLTCRALREAVDPLVTSLVVPADPTALTPVEAREAAKRWPGTQRVMVFAPKELALLADGGTLGAAFPLQELALYYLLSCSNRQLASIAHSVRPCPHLTCLRLHFVGPGCLPALDPLVDCRTLRSLHLTLAGHVGSYGDVWHPQRLQALSSLTQLQDIHLVFMHVPGSREAVEVLSLEGVLEGVTALQELEVGETFTLGAGSFAALASCSRLQRLQWSCCSDSAVHHLAAASAHLQQLDLDQCEGIVDLSGFELLTSLQRLSLANCVSLALGRDVPSGSMRPAFATLVHLTYLDLSGADGIADIDCLSQLTLLTHLDVADTSIDSLQPLAQLTRLTHLDVSNTHIDSLQPLQQLTALRHFGAGGCTHVHDFSPLRRCSRLERLSLHGADLTADEEQLFASAGGDAAPALPCLHYLDISQALLPDLSVLSHLTRLQELRMYNMSPTSSDASDTECEVPEPAPSELDLSPLSCLTGLTALDLSFCRLRTPPSFTPLLGLSMLRVLRCEELESEAEACLSTSLMELEVLGFDFDDQSEKLPALLPAD